ncbi:hypothetical protein [Enterococcus sp. AZ196]|uniref:hypothetical protein n=1 Tax=Enterococcus sp. AZ196 TaxID=2774659 RepID=UPI003D2AB497
MTIDFEKRAIERMLEAGISLGHIQSQKRNFFQDSHVENYYNKIENSEHPCKKIPIKKIIGVKADWAVEEKSVYDLFMKELPEGRDAGKINENLTSLKKNGLAFQQAFYSDDFNLEGSSLLRFNYYKEDDCYILQNDGVHRVIAAKMFNAPSMSGIVTDYELDEEKKELYEEYESLKEILRLTDIKGLTLDYFQEKMSRNKKE